MAQDENSEAAGHGFIADEQQPPYAAGWVVGRIPALALTAPDGFVSLASPAVQHIQTGQVYCLHAIAPAQAPDSVTQVVPEVFPPSIAATTLFSQHFKSLENLLLIQSSQLEQSGESAGVYDTSAKYMAAITPRSPNFESAVFVDVRERPDAMNETWRVMPVQEQIPETGEIICGVGMDRIVSKDYRRPISTHFITPSHYSDDNGYIFLETSGEEQRSLDEIPSPVRIAAAIAFVELRDIYGVSLTTELMADLTRGTDDPRFAHYHLPRVSGILVSDVERETDKPVFSAESTLCHQWPKTGDNIVVGEGEQAQFWSTEIAFGEQGQAYPMTANIKATNMAPNAIFTFVPVSMTDGQITQVQIIQHSPVLRELNLRDFYNEVPASVRRAMVDMYDHFADSGASKQLPLLLGEMLSAADGEKLYRHFMREETPLSTRANDEMSVLLERYRHVVEKWNVARTQPEQVPEPQGQESVQVEFDLLPEYVQKNVMDAAHEMANRMAESMRDASGAPDNQGHNKSKKEGKGR